MLSSDSFCVVVKSSEKNPCNAFWKGDELSLNFNGQRKAIIPKGFRNFQYCISSNQVDIVNDRIQLQSTKNDGVCIESFFVNSKQILVGAMHDQPSFVIDADQNSCNRKKMTTSEITIQNQTVTSSKCKGKND